MKKLIVSALIVLFSTTVFAGIDFVQNKKWKEIIALAKKENKLIFLDGYATWCGPCQYMESDIFTLNSIGTYFNQKFINVRLNMEEGEGLVLAEQFDLTAYPTLYFINGDGELVHKYIGALDEEAFLELGKTAVDPQKQYFTLKRLASGGQLSPAAFHDWIHTADDMEDEELDSVIVKYLTHSRYPLMEAEMLTVIMDHAQVLNKDQITTLFTNRKKVEELTEKTPEDFDALFLKKVLLFAMDQSYKSDELDFDIYKKTIARFYPQKALLETQKMKVRYYANIEQTEDAFKALTTCIENASLQLSAFELASLITDFSEMIVENNRSDEYIRKVKAYKLLPKEKDMEYYKDFALMIIYVTKEDSAKVAEMSARIIDNANTPEYLAALVNRLNAKE